MSKLIKIEWQDEITTQEFSAIEQSETTLINAGFTVELVGKRPNDRG